MKRLFLCGRDAAQHNAGIEYTKIKLLIGGCLYLLAPSLSAEVSAQLLVFSCRNCHSSAAEAIPQLDSLTAEQISQVLLDFKNNRRESTVMGRLTKGLNDTEIQAVADWVVKHRR